MICNRKPQPPPHPYRRDGHDGLHQLPSAAAHAAQWGCLACFLLLWGNHWSKITCSSNTSAPEKTINHLKLDHLERHFSSSSFPSSNLFIEHCVRLRYIRHGSWIKPSFCEIISKIKIIKKKHRTVTWRKWEVYANRAFNIFPPHCSAVSIWWH